MLGWKLELSSISFEPRGNLRTKFSYEDDIVFPAYIKGSRACFVRVSCDSNSPK